MSFLKKNGLLIVVFITGAAVLAVEVTALRILAPYYGNTIFTASSVIGVILAALSIGYYIGGQLADKYPSARWFFGIILTSGVSILLLQLLSAVLLPYLGNALSLTKGPLISSIVLFLIPAILLGTLSPFAIKLQEKNRPGMGIGSITGGVFFWSTLGSIFGSFFTGFYLIPHYGVSEIIIGTGILLVVLGLCPFVVWGAGVKQVFPAFMLVTLGGTMMYMQPLVQFDHETVYIQDGVYERLYIYDGEQGGQPTRFFKQDNAFSGAMYLESDDHVYEYSKYYRLHELFTDKVDNALVLGGGIYTVPKALLKDLPEVSIDIAEIEPSLINLAHQYFRLPESDRLHNYVEDGRRFLHDAEVPYDFIFSDVYRSLHSVPTHFATKEFFQTAYDKLSEDGVFVANLIGSLSRQQPSFIFSEIKTLKSVFPNVHAFAVVSPAFTGVQNIMLVATKGADSFDREKINANSDAFFNNLSSKVVDMSRYDLSPYVVFTDNYAPTDFIISKSFIEADSKDIFAGDEIMALIDQQLRYGPRYIGSDGHEGVQNMIIAEMETVADEVYQQSWQHVAEDGKAYNLMNVVARLNLEQEKRILLGTHYDSRRFADTDKWKYTQPVPGANDSASGTAVLMELASLLSHVKDLSGVGVDIVFFDGGEGLPESETMFLGSTYFSDNLQEFYPKTLPAEAIVIDMVCDKRTDLEWITDEQVHDHTSLAFAGIKSKLLIGADYSAFHTTKDTIDKCHPDSLEEALINVVSEIYSI